MSSVRTELSEVRERKLFVRWVLLSAVSVVAMLALGIVYGGRIHGPSLVAISLILLAYAASSVLAGRLCWELGEPHEFVEANRDEILHRAKWILYWAWLAPMVGIMGTIFGMWSLITSSGTSSDLHARIVSGGGVALAGSFIGVLVTVFLTTAHRMIEHEIERY